MSGINEYLNDNERRELINDILTVYNYGLEGLKKLEGMIDDQLFAYRESLRKQGKIQRFLSGRFSVHISVFMKRFGADSYKVDTKWENNKLHTIFYLGLYDDQLGYIVLSEQWKITTVYMYDDFLTRYNGLELIIDGKKG